MRFPVAASAQASVPPPAPVPMMMTSWWPFADILGSSSSGSVAASEGGRDYARPPSGSVAGRRLRGRDGDLQYSGHRRVMEPVLHLAHRLLLARTSIGRRLSRRL